ncbi:MAG: hypothetical protein JWQ40_1875 [Segetibacter sp.]|nr:hypothetical protein [Segetibacter sp.]
MIFEDKLVKETIQRRPIKNLQVQVSDTTMIGGDLKARTPKTPLTKQIRYIFFVKCFNKPVIFANQFFG